MISRRLTLPWKTRKGVEGLGLISKVPTHLADNRAGPWPDPAGF